MKTKGYITASALIIAVVAVVHLLRFVQGWPVLLGTLVIPVWMSGFAVVLSAGIAVWARPAKGKRLFVRW